MGKTSSAVKQKYNAKTYDQIKIEVKKGKREIYKEYARSKGMSLAGLIQNLIEADMNANQAEPTEQ